MDIFDLLSNGTTDDKTLDEYQTHQVRQLVADLRHLRFAALQSPTGAGKTLVARAVVHSLWDIQDALTATAVVVPQNQIKDPWCQQMRLTPASLTNTVSKSNALPVVYSTEGRWHTLTKATKATLSTHLHSSNKKVITTTHSTLASLAPDQDLPADCSRRLLLVDEGQHLGEKTKIQKVIQTWVDRGGQVLVCSAALIRSKGDVAIPEHVVPVTRTLVEHLREGYAPTKIRFISQVLVDTLAQSMTDLFTDQEGSQGFKGSSIEHQAKQVVEWWVEKGRPKFILIVPTGVSLKWAKAIIDAFKKAGVHEQRILNGVGTKAEDTRRVIQTLVAEEARLRRGEVSEIDVVIACRRFDEATNWPVASHMGIIGLPSFIGRIIQLLGRLLRLKLGGRLRKALPDYIEGTPYHQFGDEAEMVFFLPDKAQTAWDAVWASKHHLDLVLMMAALMEDTELGADYLATIRDRANDHDRARNTKDPHLNRDTWDRIASIAGETVERFQHLYIQVREAAFYLGLQGNLAPTDDELQQFMTRRMGLTEEDAAQALFVKAIRHQMGDKTILSNLDARITQELLGPQTSPTIIRQTMRDIFDQCAKELVVNNSALFTEAKALRARLSDLTVRDPEIVAQKLRDTLPTEQLTEQEAIEAVEDFPGPGRPNMASGLIAGYNKVTWRDLNSQARRFSPPTNLHLLVEKVLGPEGWAGKSQQQLRFEKSVQARPGIFEALAEDALAQMTAHPGVKFTVRTLYEERKKRGELLNLDNAGCGFYAQVFRHIVPAIAACFETQGAGTIWSQDWTALGIDPLDKKWDEYQVKAGGKLPRTMPKTPVSQKSDMVREYEAFIKNNPSLLPTYVQIIQTKVDQGVRSVSIRFLLDEARNGISQAPTFKNAFSPFLARTLRIWKPTLASYITDGTNINYTPDMVALGLAEPEAPPVKPTQVVQVAATDPQFLTDTFNSLASLGLWS